MELRQPSKDKDTSLDYNDVKNATEWLGIGASGSTVYSGKTTSGGTATLPTGWSMNKSGTGVYEVTHNLGHSNYAVTVSNDDGGIGYHSVAYTSTTFTLRSFNTSASLEDRAMHFIVSLF